MKPSQKPLGKPGAAWQVAQAAGVDMALLESNLLKTPAERLGAHQRALEMALALRQAMKERCVQS